MTSLYTNLLTLKPLWDVISPRRRRQLFALQLMSLLSAVGEVGNLATLLPFLRLLANPAEGLKALGPLAMPLRALPIHHLLLGLGLSFITVVVVSSTLRVLTIRFQLRLAALIAVDLGHQVFAAVLVRPYAWHLSNNSSTVLTYLTRDVDRVCSSVQALLLLGMNLVLVLFLGGSLIALAPAVMITVAGFIISFYLLVFSFTRGKLRHNSEISMHGYQGSVQVAQESLGGIRDVLLDRTQLFFLQAYRNNILQQKLASAAINIYAQVPRYLIEGFAIIMIVGVSLFLAFAGQGIERQLPLLGTLALGAYRLLQPMQLCFSSVSSLQANQVSLTRLEPFLTTTARSTSKAPILFDSVGRVPELGGPLVELNLVNFRYSQEGPWVLKDLQLSVSTGERIAFVGSTGSGKSTCCDLILGLLSPSSGQVLVDGNDLHGNQGLVDAWQAQVAHVPQNIYLSDSSYAANIAFGISEHQIDQQRVQRSAEQARIAELIEDSPRGYQTLVGERGVRLSGGQRQRIGIARALYKQANLLVLDEATSALDNRTEAEVMEAIDGLGGQLTVIFIAHRLSTVRNCDRIVVLEQGRISGIGEFSELLSNHSGFRRLAYPKPN